MEKKYFILLLILYCCTQAFGQDFKWVRQVNGAQDLSEYARYIKVDANGNTYTLGTSASYQFDIDPTQSGVQMVVNNDTQAFYPTNIYLTKLDDEGNFVWGKTFSVFKDDDLIYGLEVDSAGNLYILAFITELYQNQTIVWNYGFVNVIKVDPNGNEVYRRKFQNLSNINSGEVWPITSFCLDSSDNIYLAGTFKFDVQFDNNPLHNLSAPGYSMYLMKLNQNGDIVWNKNLNERLSGPMFLRIDSNDRLSLLYNCSENPIGGFNSLLKIQKINANNGDQIWSKSIVNAFLSNFKLDAQNRFAIAGMASNNNLVDIDPDPAVVNNVQDQSFLLHLDANGNYDGAEFFDSDIFFHALTIDAEGNYHLGGRFGTTNAGPDPAPLDFDPSANTFPMRSISYYEDGFYLKLDNNRNFEQALMYGKPIPAQGDYCYYSRSEDIAVLDEKVYIAGEFGGRCDLDTSLTSNLILNSFTGSTANMDGFILKLENCSTTAPQGNHSQSFCSGQNPTVNHLVPQSASIHWYDSATGTIPLGSGTALVNGHTYYASRQSATCPESLRLDVSVTINPTPNAPTAANQAFCAGDHPVIADLVAVGTQLKWYDTPTAPNALPVTTTLHDQATYYVSQTVNGCESSRTPIDVTVRSVALPSVVSPQDFCVQQNATLNDLNAIGLNIEWHDAAENGNLLPNTTALVDGITYYASQTNNGCGSDRIGVTVTIHATIAAWGNPNQNFCANQNPTLADIAVNGSNIVWHDASNNVLPDSTALVDGVTYYATQTIGGCESVNQWAVRVGVTNTLNATNYSETLCDYGNDGTETIDLADYNLNLIANTANCLFEYYMSFSGAANQQNTALLPNANHHALTVGQHTVFVRITSANGCHQVVALTLTLESLPALPIPATVPICNNGSTSVDAGPGFDSYVWSDASTAQTLTASTPGNYWVTVTQNHGSVICSATQYFTVVRSGEPTISHIEISDWTDTENTMHVIASGLGDFQYSVDGVHYQPSPIFNWLRNGVYSVFVKDRNGCGEAVQEVFLLMYPKFFTPNSDGYHDNWSIQFSELEAGLTVKIFDRYGKILKALNHLESWDGTYNGKALPSEDYWFVVTRANGKQHRGHFTLKR